MASNAPRQKGKGTESKTTKKRGRRPLAASSQHAGDESNNEPIKELEIGKVYRVTSTAGDWAGRIDKNLGKGRWRVYDLEAQDFAVVRSEEIAGLWESVPATTLTRPCWNCGSIERDEDGECAACREPRPEEEPTKKRKGRKQKANRDKVADEASVQAGDEAADVTTTAPDPAASVEATMPDNPAAVVMSGLSGSAGVDSADSGATATAPPESVESKTPVVLPTDNGTGSEASQPPTGAPVEAAGEGKPVSLTGLPSESTEVSEASSDAEPVSLADLQRQLDKPDKDWNDKRLEEYIHWENKWINFHDQQTAIHVRRLGHALDIILTRLPHGEREAWLKSRKINTTLASRARRLFKNTESEDQLKGLDKMEAYYRFHVLTRPKEEDLPEEAPKVPKEEKKKLAQQDPPEETPPPKEPQDLLSFLGRMLVSLDLYYDEGAWIKDDNKSPDDYLRLITQIETRLAALRTLVEGQRNG